MQGCLSLQVYEKLFKHESGFFEGKYLYFSENERGVRDFDTEGPLGMFLNFEPEYHDRRDANGNLVKNENYDPNTTYVADDDDPSLDDYTFDEETPELQKLDGRFYFLLKYQPRLENYLRY